MFERYRRNGLVCFENPGEGGGGTGGGEGGGQGSRRSSADVLQQYGNDAIRMADRVATLEAENYRYREQKRDLTAQVESLKKVQTPEGATVLTAADATAYEAYKAFGKPDEVKAALAERETLAAEVATTKRERALGEVAAAAGWNPAPLRRVGLDREYELREQTVDGKAAKVPYIKDGDAFKPLADYAASEWPDLIPSLTATGGGNGQGNGAGGGQVIPRQQGSQGQRPANKVDAFLQQRNERAAAAPNPLAPTTA